MKVKELKALIASIPDQYDELEVITTNPKYESIPASTNAVEVTDAEAGFAFFPYYRIDLVKAPIGASLHETYADIPDHTKPLEYESEEG